MALQNQEEVFALLDKNFGCCENLIASIGSVSCPTIKIHNKNIQPTRVYVSSKGQTTAYFSPEKIRYLINDFQALGLHYVDYYNCGQFFTTKNLVEKRIKGEELHFGNFLWSQIKSHIPILGIVSNISVFNSSHVDSIKKLIAILDCARYICPMSDVGMWIELSNNHMGLNNADTETFGPQGDRRFVYMEEAGMVEHCVNKISRCRIRFSETQEDLVKNAYAGEVEYLSNFVANNMTSKFALSPENRQNLQKLKLYLQVTKIFIHSTHDHLAMYKCAPVACLCFQKSSVSRYLLSKEEVLLLYNSLSLQLILDIHTKFPEVDQALPSSARLSNANIVGYMKLFTELLKKDDADLTAVEQASRQEAGALVTQLKPVMRDLSSVVGAAEVVGISSGAKDGIVGLTENLATGFIDFLLKKTRFAGAIASVKSRMEQNNKFRNLLLFTFQLCVVQDLLNGDDYSVIFAYKQETEEVQNFMVLRH